MAHSHEGTISPRDLETIASNAKFAFEKSGHLFQSAIVREAQAAAKKNSPFLLRTTEHPIRVQGYDSSIDIILDHHSMNWTLAIECKRMSGAFANWCAYSEPMASRDRIRRYCMGDLVTVSNPYSGAHRARAGVWIRDEIPEMAHVVTAVKYGTENDKQANAARDSFSKACTQVCRGAAGLVQERLNNPRLFSDGTIRILPIVVTTANLFMLKCELDAIRPETGRFDDGDYVQAKPVPWFFFQNRVEHGIRHDALNENFDSHLHFNIDIRRTENPAFSSEIEHNRTIAVVQSQSFERFLQQISEVLF